MKTPLVSIVVPLFNCEPFIERCILSIQQQTYKNWELFVIDDCSLDNGVEVVRKVIKGDDRCHIILSERNSGPAYSRNLGIAAATGRFISFLDADDQWHVEKLQQQVNLMLSKGVALSYADYSTISEGGMLLKEHNSPPEKVDYHMLLKSNFIGCLTAMYDVELLGKMYMPNISKRQDYGLWLKILKKVDFACCVPGGPLAVYTARSGSVSSNKVKLLKYNWKIFREEEKFSLLRSFWYLMFNIYYKLIK